MVNLCRICDGQIYSSGPGDELWVRLAPLNGFVLTPGVGGFLVGCAVGIIFIFMVGESECNVENSLEDQHSGPGPKLHRYQMVVVLM